MARTLPLPLTQTSACLLSVGQLINNYTSLAMEPKVIYTLTADPIVPAADVIQVTSSATSRSDFELLLLGFNVSRVQFWLFLF
jgi:hypothetical protein